MKAYLFDKCIGFGSGKGGVGKSTTAINVALGLAIQKRRVLIVDLDPFSNIATILDIHDNTKKYDNSILNSDALRFEDVTIYFNDYCHIMLSGLKTLEEGAHHAFLLLTKKFHRHIVQNYDYIVLDFPAGITSSYIQQFIPYIKHLVVVVQPEPTSHVSSGAFIKTALDINNKIKIQIWHNKFKNIVTETFHSLDVIRNYNALINKQYKIDTRKKRRCTTLVTVPHDTMLDFLSSVQSPKEYISSKIHNIVQYIREILVLNCLYDENISDDTQQFLYHFVQNYDMNQTADTLIDAMDRNMKLYTKHKLLRNHDVDKINWSNTHDKIKSLFSLKIYLQCVKIITCHDEILSNVSSSSHERMQSILEKAILDLLHIIIMEDYTSSKRMEQSCKMLLLYFALLLTAAAPQLEQEINALIPMKRNSDRNDMSLRDRRTQIQNILKRDESLHTRYLISIQNIYSLGMISLNRLQKDQQLFAQCKESIINKPEKQIYIKIIGLMVHEIAHSGLGVVIGMKSSIGYTKISAAISKLQSKLND